MPVADIKHYHLGVCPCCGGDTACTRGVVVREGERLASYLVKWTVGDPSHGMGWLISLPQGQSGKEVSVSLGYSFEHRSFMVRHVGDYSWEPHELAGFGALLDRDQVIGTALAEQAFAVVDDIWLNDPYVQDFVASATEEGTDVEPSGLSQ
jgi:hypothetical protein